MEKATKYIRGRKPSAKSEYFGKSYAELQGESKKAKSEALRKRTLSERNRSGERLSWKEHKQRLKEEN